MEEGLSGRKARELGENQGVQSVPASRDWWVWVGFDLPFPLPALIKRRASNTSASNSRCDVRKQDMFQEISVLCLCLYKSSYVTVIWRGTRCKSFSQSMNLYGAQERGASGLYVCGRCSMQNDCCVLWGNTRAEPQSQPKFVMECG